LAVDEVRNSLGLSKIQLTVQKSPLCEFPGARQTSTQRRNTRQHLIDDYHAAVPVELKHILASIRSRCFIENCEAVVQRITCAIQERANGCLARPWHTAQHAVGNRLNLRP
jgi:hypothetical protein